MREIFNEKVALKKVSRVVCYGSEVFLLPSRKGKNSTRMVRGDDDPYITNPTGTNRPTLIDIILYLYSAFFKNLRCFTDIVSN